MRKKGDLDEERRRDLFEGEAAASSVLIRANDAVDKEQRQQAVGELQSRVEDWKGHKIEHFGELLLYGDFLVLKGDGVREVEREVRIIFDALDPECRAVASRALPHVLALVHQYRSTEVPAVVNQQQLNERCKHPFGLDIVPEEQFDKEISTVSLLGVTDTKLGEDSYRMPNSHDENQDQGEEKLRGLYKSPVKSFFSRSETSLSSKTEFPPTLGISQSQDKDMALNMLEGSQSSPQSSPQSSSQNSPLKRSFSESEAILPLETEFSKGPGTLQTHSGENAAKESKSPYKGSLTSLFSKSNGNLSLVAESPKGPDIPQSHDEEIAQNDLRLPHMGPAKSFVTKTKATPSPRTGSPKRPDTPQSLDKDKTPEELRGPHRGPMKSFLSKLSAIPSPLIRVPTNSGLETSNESRITLRRFGEGSGSGACLTPPNPSRKSTFDGSGALAKFGHKFKRKTRDPQIRSYEDLFEKIYTQVLMAAELTYYFAFNGPLCNGTTFLNFERPGLPGVSTFHKSWLQNHNKKDEEANERGLMAPVSMQYKVYLFERILLCCKEINPNKQKNKMLGNNKSLLDKKGKPRLQLKGRIFMQNVTDVMSIGKAGKCHLHLLIRNGGHHISAMTFTDAVYFSRVLLDPDLLEGRPRSRKFRGQVLQRRDDEPMAQPSGDAKENTE